MHELKNFETASIEQLWRLHETIAAALAARLNDERELLERRLAMLSRAATKLGARTHLYCRSSKIPPIRESAGQDEESARAG